MRALTRRPAAEEARRLADMGVYKVPHFDGKGAINHVFSDLCVPTTCMLASFYWENLIHLGPRRAEDGGPVLTLPMADKKVAVNGSRIPAL